MSLARAARLLTVAADRDWWADWHAQMAQNDVRYAKCAASSRETIRRLDDRGSWDRAVTEAWTGLSDTEARAWAAARYGRDNGEALRLAVNEALAVMVAEAIGGAA